MFEDTTSDSFDLFISQSSWMHQIFSTTLNNCCMVLLLVAHNFSKLRKIKKGQELKGYAFHLCLCKQTQ